MREKKNMQENEPYFDDEIDLLGLFRIILKYKRFIAQITIIFFIVSIATSLLMTNYYKSESLLMARSNVDNQGVLSQYSGLASLAGISMPSSGGDKAQEAIEVIKSRKFVKHLITFEGVLPSLMAPKSYNTKTKELFFDRSIYDSEANLWKRRANDNFRTKPSYIEAHKVYIEDVINISQDNLTGFITIKIEHISPVFAKEFLDLIINQANILLRNRDMQSSSDALEYLTSELSKTGFVEIKESIASMIEAQLETQMLTQINEDYILIEIDPPFISEIKSKPSRVLICFTGILIGFFLGSILVLVQEFSGSTFLEKHIKI